MPQLVVNMKFNTQNVISCNLKNNRFKMRHTPYSNRWQQTKKIKYYEKIIISIINLRNKLYN